MLSALHVKNLAIVENISVEFTPGLNTITGETGAGKSIIIGALSLVLGDRADKTLIRAGEEQCSVEAVFHLADSSDIDEILEELGITQCDNGALIIRRVITTSGGSKNIVNDCSTSLQTLKKIGDNLVDMHGPHDHQSLLNEDFQINLLDAFGHLWKHRSAYEDAYGKLLDIEKARRELDGDDSTVAQQIDMLSYQVKEIEDAKVEDGEDVSVENELTVVANAGRILELATATNTALTEDEGSAFNTMVIVQKHLGELAGLTKDAVEWRKEAETIAIQLQELASNVAQKLGGIESDPARLQWLEDRMALINKLKRKYGGSIAEMRAFLMKSKERLQSLLSRGDRIKEIEAKLEKAKTTVLSLGRKLSEERATTAKSMAKTIVTELRGLGFPHASFEVGLSQCDPGPAGLDKVEFGFAPNAGEPMRPLRAIASSGEISRVMLATKTVLARHDRIPVLVFDEIDANVGGEMGNAIGERLQTIAKNHQVLCITHFPQVAVFGKTHFVVAKEVEGGRTRTRINVISGEARAEEIARMLGGRDLTSVTLRHAREMLKM